jgi:hypothetical protein
MKIQFGLFETCQGPLPEDPDIPSNGPLISPSPTDVKPTRLLKKKMLNFVVKHFDSYQIENCWY